MTKVPLRWGTLIRGEAAPASGHGLYGKSLYLLLSFAVNLKLLQEIKFIKIDFKNNEEG